MGSDPILAPVAGGSAAATTAAVRESVASMPASTAGTNTSDATDKASGPHGRDSGTLRNRPTFGPKASPSATSPRSPRVTISQLQLSRTHIWAPPSN